MRSLHHLRGPLAALLLAIWVLGGSADLVVHATVAHVLCAEHGVVEHRTDDHAVTGEPRSDGPLGPTASAADEADGHGAACECVPAPTAVVRAAALVAPELAALVPATPQPEPPVVARRPPLSFAPKTSPPA